MDSDTCILLSNCLENQLISWLSQVYMGQMMVCKNYTPETGMSKAIKVGDPVHILKMVSSYDECLI